MKRATWIRLGILAVLVTLIVVVFVFVPLQEFPEQFKKHLGSLGFGRYVALTGIFVVACLLMIPVTPISLAAGMLFGFAMGLATIAVGSILGPALTFFVGKFLGRGWITATIAKNRTLGAIDRAVADQGFKIIFLARLSPFVPYGVMNYMLSLSRVSFVVYITATFLGVLPTTVAYAYLGSLAENPEELVQELSKGGTIQALLFWGGLAATLVVSIIITMVAKKALAKALGDVAKEIPSTLPEMVHAVADAVSLGPEPDRKKLSDAEAVLRLPH
jgi:uncharacterized membrane protein YdjX (TVP38/TMEM64 family)